MKDNAFEETFFANLSNVSISAKFCLLPMCVKIKSLW